MKFKVGDQVEVVGAKMSGFLYGLKGKVVAIEKDIPAGKEYPYVVEFPYEQRWTFTARELKLLGEEG